MIHVLIQDDGETVGEMRIECISPSLDRTNDNYSVEYAADSGGAWVDLKQRMLYNFNTRRYNTLALVNEALNVLELKDMEMTDETDPGRVARGQRGAWKALSGKIADPVRHHGPPVWGEQSEQQCSDARGQGDGSEDRE